MGTWGTGVLDDDAALDIYHDYLELYNFGKEPSEIRLLLQPKYGTSLRQLDSIPFWLGLAHAQWECQALDADVLAHVRQIVNKNIDEDDWEDKYSTRKKVLEKFLKKISQPAKKARKRVKPRLFALHFERGDCLAIRYADGSYGAAVCLWGSKEKAKLPGAVIAITRVHQSTPPTVEDVAASHVLVRTWGNEAHGSEPTPAISGCGIRDAQTALEASSLTAIGKLPVTRTFERRLYPCGFSWDFNRFYGPPQFAWEKDHPADVDLSLPVREFIVRRDDDWGALGELFVSPSDNVELSLAREKSIGAKLHHMNLTGREVALLRFLADYVGMPHGKFVKYHGEWLAARGCVARS